MTLTIARVSLVETNLCRLYEPRRWISIRLYDFAETVAPMDRSASAIANHPPHIAGLGEINFFFSYCRRGCGRCR